MPLKQTQKFDWKSLQPHPIIGVDEAGRGCLAGRVYAGAVILMSEIDVGEYTDSKLLNGSKREKLFESIIKHHRYGIGFATALEIDEVNILNASMLAMRRALIHLGVSSGHVIVDGHMAIRELQGFTQTPLVKGDFLAAPVGAASIVAKVSRDRYARELHEKYPGYEFAQHKGYPTPEHKKILEKRGPTPEHRFTFAGVRELAEGPTS